MSTREVKVLNHLRKHIRTASEIIDMSDLEFDLWLKECAEETREMSEELDNK